MCECGMHHGYVLGCVCGVCGVVCTMVIYWCVCVPVHGQVSLTLEFITLAGLTDQ